ncbi:hypothetical protein J32TS6_13730 [Virgibacillus pantothenticus]|uniref:type II toxin-antitoxin system RelE family toxin n=1 Tax=Virgibacillus pantothenticus TaxID=1473 RepID=UPI001B2152CC|nr:type II toxin-antitoxin system RelE/ParE family toxin [Virgibacillus pantothenticus]GIP62818.1 hypothetical protein J32TS6_13730 [Virgibacillus pantothenticus]
MYDIIFSKQAKKFIDKQDKVTKKRLRNAMLELSENPYRAKDVKKLKGDKAYRKRVTNFRIIFDIIDQKLVVNVLKVDNRGQVYRK